MERTEEAIRQVLEHMAPAPFLWHGGLSEHVETIEHVFAPKEH